MGPVCSAASSTGRATRLQRGRQGPQRHRDRRDEGPRRHRSSWAGPPAPSPPTRPSARPARRPPPSPATAAGCRWARVLLEAEAADTSTMTPATASPASYSGVGTPQPDGRAPTTRRRQRRCSTARSEFVKSTIAYRPGTPHGSRGRRRGHLRPTALTSRDAGRALRRRSIARCSSGSRASVVALGAVEGRSATTSVEPAHRPRPQSAPPTVRGSLSVVVAIGDHPGQLKPRVPVEATLAARPATLKRSSTSATPTSPGSSPPRSGQPATAVTLKAVRPRTRRNLRHRADGRARRSRPRASPSNTEAQRHPAATPIAPPDLGRTVYGLADDRPYLPLGESPTPAEQAAGPGLVSPRFRLRR